MHRWTKIGLLAIAAGLMPQVAQAQVIVSSPPGHVVLPAASYYAAPVTVYSPPVTVYSPPPVAYYPAPVTSYYAAPVTAYYATPVTAYYAAPVTAYTPGVVTTRTYTGLGIFRPRGVYTESYVTPVAPRASYYYPVYVR